MDFGEWTLSKRKEQGLDIQSFAEKTHVNIGTISRIENGHTQPTLYTAFRITEGLGVAFPALLKDLDLQYVKSDQSNLIDEKSILTILDVEKLVDAFHLKDVDVRSYLALLLNRLYKKAFENMQASKKHSSLIEEDILVPSDNEFFSANDINKLLSSSSLYRFELRYPRGMRSTTIGVNYDSKGVIINNDIGPFIRGLGLRTGSLSKSSNNLLSRVALGNGSFDRIKLNEIISAEKELALSGRLLGIFWEVCRFDEKFNPPVIRQNIFVQETLEDNDDLYPLNRSSKRSLSHKIATLYVIIYRWYQYVIDVECPIDFEKYS